MPLSCSCDFDFEPEPGDWSIEWNESKNDFELFQEPRRKRCCSCNELIDIGAECLKFIRYRYPSTEVEARIHNTDFEDIGIEEPTIKISPIYHCEKCGEIYLNLVSVGFECLFPTENMPEMLKEYQDDYAPPKLNKK